MCVCIKHNANHLSLRSAHFGIAVNYTNLSYIQTVFSQQQIRHTTKISELTFMILYEFSLLVNFITLKLFKSKLYSYSIWCEHTILCFLHDTTCKHLFTMIVTRNHESRPYVHKHTFFLSQQFLKVFEWFKFIHFSITWFTSIWISHHNRAFNCGQVYSRGRQYLDSESICPKKPTLKPNKIIL